MFNVLIDNCLIDIEFVLLIIFSLFQFFISINHFLIDFNFEFYFVKNHQSEMGGMISLASH